MLAATVQVAPIATAGGDDTPAVDIAWTAAARSVPRFKFEGEGASPPAAGSVAWQLQVALIPVLKVVTETE